MSIIFLKQWTARCSAGQFQHLSRVDSAPIPQLDRGSYWKPVLSSQTDKVAVAPPAVQARARFFNPIIIWTTARFASVFAAGRIIPDEDVQRWREDSSSEVFRRRL